jgi:hypothetical protein
MINANQFQDYVRQKEHAASIYDTCSTSFSYTTTTGQNFINIKDKEEDEEITQALPDTHIFDPEDLFL